MSVLTNSLATFGVQAAHYILMLKNSATGRNGRKTHSRPVETIQAFISVV